MHSILENVTFSTYLSLTKQKYDYDVIVLDECHNLLFTHDNYLKNVSSRILGLTGTPPRHDNSEKGIMVNKYCPIRFEYLTDDAVGDNILNDYKIYVHYLSLRTNKELSITHKNGSFMTSELLNYMYWTNRVDDARPGKSKQIASVMRMKAMMEYPSKEDYAKQLLNQQTDKCILFCNTQAQSDKLCDYSYHSNNSDSEENLIKFKDGDINKLSCVLQLNEGVNIPNLKSGIIMHSYGNERKSSQRIGRLMRLNPKSTATIHILCYRNTVDEYWVQSALKDFDETKIIHLKDD
jgi:superfamily II DNA or RNA helicase